MKHLSRKHKEIIKYPFNFQKQTAPTSGIVTTERSVVRATPLEAVSSSPP
jgi:hypothetical protein